MAAFVSVGNVIRAWWEKYFPTAACEVLTAQDPL
jgi:hypothetical protein